MNSEIDFTVETSTTKNRKAVKRKSTNDSHDDGSDGNNGDGDDKQSGNKKRKKTFDFATVEEECDSSRVTFFVDAVLSSSELIAADYNSCINIGLMIISFYQGMRCWKARSKRLFKAFSKLGGEKYHENEVREKFEELFDAFRGRSLDMSILLEEKPLNANEARFQNALVYAPQGNKKFICDTIVEFLLRIFVGHSTQRHREEGAHSMFLQQRHLRTC